MASKPKLTSLVGRDRGLVSTLVAPPSGFGFAHEAHPPSPGDRGAVSSHPPSEQLCRPHCFPPLARQALTGSLMCPGSPGARPLGLPASRLPVGKVGTGRVGTRQGDRAPSRGCVIAGGCRGSLGPPRRVGDRGGEGKKWLAQRQRGAAPRPEDRDLFQEVQGAEQSGSGKSGRGWGVLETAAGPGEARAAPA